MPLLGSQWIRGCPHHNFHHSRCHCLVSVCHTSPETKSCVHRDGRGWEWRAFAWTIYASDQLTCMFRSGLILDSALHRIGEPCHFLQEALPGLSRAQSLPMPPPWLTMEHQRFQSLEPWTREGPAGGWA